MKQLINLRNSVLIKKIILFILLTLLLITGCSKNDLVLKVGFIYPGTAADEGINQMQEEACNNMVEYFNGKVQAISKSSITTENIDSAINNMINSGVSVIFISGNEFDSQVIQAAQNFPTVDFIVYNGNIDMANVKNYSTRDYEADYLCGILAGSSTSNNKIGYLAPDNSNQNLIHINAFALGVLNSNDKAVIDLIYSGENPSTSKINADVSRLASNGCDVIASCNKNNATLVEAEKNGLKVIGSSPSSIQDSNNYLTSVKLNLTDFYIDEINSVLNGTFDNSRYVGTIYDDFVGLDKYSNNVPDRTKRLVNSTTESIKKGNLAVFTGPFSSSDGIVIAQDGQVLSEIDLQNMNYLLSNIRDIN